MMCYRDRSFCDAPCKKRDGRCWSSYEHAVIQKSKSKDTFIRETMPICTCDYSDVCGGFEPLDEVNK